MEAWESERARIARTLHDGPVQDLLAAELARNVEGLNPGGPRLRDVARALRDVSEALRPPTLEPFGLEAAVHGVGVRFRERFPTIDLVLDIEGGAVEPTRPAQAAVLRALNEALRNTVAHGPPQRVVVRYRTGRGRARLEVLDDGPGTRMRLDPESLALSGRYGIFAVATHAESVGGELSVTSTPGRTVVSISVPVPDPT